MADAQFAVDIAAKLTGRETLDDLDRMTAELMGAGRNADFFQQAMQQVGHELDAASAAAKAANEALADGNAKYNELERAANKAAKAAESAGQKNAGVVPPEIAEQAKSAAEALSSYSDKLRVLEADAKKASDAETALEKTSKGLETLNGHVNKTLAEQGEQFEKLRGALASSGGQVGAFASRLLAPVQSFAKLSANMGAAQAAAIIMTTAVVALTAALVAGAVATVTWGIKLADSQRSIELTSEAMQAMHPELVKLGGEIESIATQTGMHAAQVQDLEVQLKAAHVAATDMPAALRAAALAEAALGNGGVQTFMQQLQAGTKSVSALAAETQKKLGGIVAKQLLSLDAQAATLKDNLAGTFGGLKIDSFLGELANIISDFDSTTELGKQIKATFEHMFQPLVDGAEVAAVKLEAFALQVLIIGVKVYIALKTWAPVLEAIGVAVGIAALAFAATFTPAIIGATVALGGMLATAAVAMASLIATAAVAAAPFLAFGAAVVAVYEALQHWTELKDFGSAMIQGMVQGILGGGKALLDAVGGVVGGAIDHAKNLLGIHSPSKVFADIGDNTVAGFTGAVDDGAHAAHEALGGMVAPSPEDMKQAALSGNAGAISAASSPADQAAPAAAPAGGGGAIVTIQQLTISGVEGAADIAPKLAEMLTSILEGKATQLGASLAGATT